MSLLAHLEKPAATADQEPVPVERTIDLAKKAFALKKYEEAVQHYAAALEQMTKKHGDDAPEMADLYFSYGQALLENAITQTSVLGKDGAEDALSGDKDEDPSKSGAFLSFSGDAEDEPVDLFKEAQQEEESDDDDEEDDDGEPEDDFNAAWEVLDLARALYEKQVSQLAEGENDELKLRLADTYLALGDVSLETEKFDQAITDYTSALDLKIPLLPHSSRQIAEVHYKLSMVLDLTSGRLSEAVEHAEKALESVERRIAELRSVVEGQGTAAEVPEESEKPASRKGKGKAKSVDESIKKLSQKEAEAEIKELEGLKEDLALKVEELKTTPNEPKDTAPALAAKALDKELGAANSSAVSSAPAVVNDLTSMVKKKKKPAPDAAPATATSSTPAPQPEASSSMATVEESKAVSAEGETKVNGATKRKAEDDVEESNSSTEKKARLEETEVNP